MGHSPSSAQPLVAPFGALLRRLLMSRRVSVATASARIGVRFAVLWQVLADARAPDALGDEPFEALLSWLGATPQERAALTAARAAPRALRPSPVFQRDRSQSRG